MRQPKNKNTPIENSTDEKEDSADVQYEPNCKKV